MQYPSLKTDIATLFPAPAALGGKALAPIAELVKLKGDAAHGATMFERAACITCHRINDKGVDFAPALSEIGSKLPKEAIYDSIINPNAAISMGFETTQLQTKDGTIALGIVRSDTKDEVVLALPGGATKQIQQTRNHQTREAAHLDDAQWPESGHEPAGLGRPRGVSPPRSRSPEVVPHGNCVLEGLQLSCSCALPTAPSRVLGCSNRALLPLNFPKYTSV